MSEVYGTSRTGKTLHTVRPGGAGGVAYCGALVPRRVELADADGAPRCSSCSWARSKARRAEGATDVILVPAVDVPAPVAVDVAPVVESAPIVESETRTMTNATTVEALRLALASVPAETRAAAERAGRRIPARSPEAAEGLARLRRSQATSYTQSARRYVLVVPHVHNESAEPCRSALVDLRALLDDDAHSNRTDAPLTYASCAVGSGDDARHAWIAVATIESQKYVPQGARDWESISRGTLNDREAATKLGMYHLGMPTIGESDDFTDALSLPYVATIVGTAIAGKNGRALTFESVLPDGMSSAEDVRIAAWTAAVERWAHVAAHATGVPCERKRCRIGEVTAGRGPCPILKRATVAHREVCDGCEDHAPETITDTLTYVRPVRCMRCDECAAAVAEAETEQRTMGVAGDVNRFNVGDCSAPVEITDTLTRALAARRALKAEARTALRPGGKQSKYAKRQRSLDDPNTPQSFHAEVTAQWSDAVESEAPDVRTLLRAVAMDVEQNGHKIIGNNGRLSDATWEALAKATRCASGRKGRETITKRLGNLREGRVTLAQLLGVS